MSNEIYQKFLGQYLGKFRIEEFMREEASGIVFLGKQESLERRVTIKLLPSYYSIQFLLQNFQKVLALEHEHIATVYDAAIAEILKQNYVVEQWIEGKNLEEVIRGKKGLPLEESIQIMLDIVRIMAAAHEKEVVHGNLCLENIVESENQKLFVKGFGVTPICVEGVSRVKGNYAYLAPELFSSGSPTFASDIYSLGCIFFQLLTGELPYGAETDGDYSETRRYIPNVKISSSKDRFMNTKRHTSSFRMVVDDSSKKKSYPIGLLRYSSTVPDPVASFLFSMLTLEPQDRFVDAKQCLIELEKLAVQYRFFVCPRCGKKNIASDVFTCNICNTESLCLSHLIPDKQCCNRCVEGTKRQTKRISERPEEWHKLIHTLRDIANNAKTGVLVLGRKPNEVALDILSEGIEFYNGSGIPALDTSNTEDPNWEIACHSLVHYLRTGDSIFEFWENDTIEKVLPSYQKAASLELHPGGYLIAFSQVTRIFRNLITEGGVCLTAQKKKLAMIFSLPGVVVGTFSQEDEKNFVPLQDSQAAFSLLESFFNPTCTSIQNRFWYGFNIKELPIFPFSAEDFLEVLRQAKGWIALGQLLPEAHSLLPLCPDWEKPFTGIDINNLSTIIAKNLSQSWDIGTVLSLTGLPELSACFLLAAIAKDRIIEVTKILLENIGKYGDRIASKTLESIFLQAYYLNPESIELCSKISQFYHSVQDSTNASLFMSKVAELYEKKGDIGLALPAYEKAITLYPQNRLNRLKVIEIYEKLDNREKLKEASLEFFHYLRQSNDGDEKVMEKVCKSLLNVDSSLALCRDELIKIYTKRKDKEKAIAEYEALVQIYEKADDKEAAAKAIVSLLALDNKRIDMKKRLQKLGYKDWKKMPRNLAWLKKVIPVSLVSMIFGLSLIFVIWREQDAWKNLAIIQAEMHNKEKYNTFRLSLMDYATSLYISNVAAQSMDLLIRMENDRVNAYKKQNEQQEGKLWKGIDYVLEFYEKRQNWKEATELCNLAKDQFSNEKIASKVANLAKDFHEKLIQKEEELNQQAQRLLQRALRYEQQKDYAQAIDVYYRILNNPNFQSTPTVKEMTLPLVVETDPSGLRCYNEEEFIGTSPLVYRYSPAQFPFIRAISRGLKEYQRQTIRTNANYIWKIHIVLK